MGEHKEKMNHKTQELSKRAMPMNVSTGRTVFLAPRSSPSCTYILLYQSRPVGPRSSIVRKSIQPSPETSVSCLPAGSERHTSLPSLAQHQQALPSKTTILKQDHSGVMENVEDKEETESIEEGEFIPNKSPNALDRCNIDYCSEESTPDSSESLHVVPKSDIGRASPSFFELRNANVTCSDKHDSARERVIATLRLYRDICRELNWEKSRAGTESTCIRRIDFHAAKEVKKRVGYVHGTKQFIGDVPGVEVGDKFHYRIELAVVGLHRPPQSGIDYMRPHTDILATSVVASWEYTDDLTNPDELVYLGQGGMHSRDKKAEDQKLIGGNLALANSMKSKMPVRVIRKDRDHTFTYDGLYAVHTCQKICRANGKMVFEFTMKRLPGQPEIHQNKKMKILEWSG